MDPYVKILQLEMDNAELRGGLARYRNGFHHMSVVSATLKVTAMGFASMVVELGAKVEPEARRDLLAAYTEVGQKIQNLEHDLGEGEGE